MDVAHVETPKITSARPNHGARKLPCMRRRTSNRDAHGSTAPSHTATPVGGSSTPRETG